MPNALSLNHTFLREHSKSGALPYLTAHTKLPSHLQCVPNAAHAALYSIARPRYLPTVTGLRKLVSTLCARLGISPPPPPPLPNLLGTLLPLHGISEGTDAAAFAKSVAEFYWSIRKIYFFYF